MNLLFKRSIFTLLMLLVSLSGLYLLTYTNWFTIHKIWILKDFHLYIIFSAWAISSCFYLHTIQRKTLSELSYLIIDSKKSPEEKEFLINKLAKEYNFEEYEIENHVYYVRKSKTGANQHIEISYNEVEYYIDISRNWLDYFLEKDILKQFEIKLK